MDSVLRIPRDKGTGYPHGKLKKTLLTVRVIVWLGFGLVCKSCCGPRRNRTLYAGCGGCCTGNMFTASVVEYLVRYQVATSLNPLGRAEVPRTLVLMVLN